MKTRNYILLLLITAFAACASPEQRASKNTDTNSVTSPDSSSSDSLSNVDGHSGDNGAGTDTTNTDEQKSIRKSGK